MMRLIYGGLPWGYVTLAGSGWWDWFMGVCHGGVQHGLDPSDGIDLWGCVMGVRDWIGMMALIGGVAPWGHTTLAGSGRWDWFIGVRHGGKQPWLDRGDGFDSWGLVTLARPGRWDWFIGGVGHWLERGDGIDLWGCVMGAPTGSGDGIDFVEARHGGGTLAGCGRWNWLMGASHGGARLDRGNGIDLRGSAMGANDTD